MSSRLCIKHERYLILIVCIGMFLSTLDTGIMNVALPSLTKLFHSNIKTMMWTISFYTLTLVSFILLFGKIGDKLGRIRIFIWGVFVLGVASILCAISINEYCLIAFRGLQGIGASMIQANSAAILSSHIKRENQTKAFGFLGISLGMGPIIGPSVASVLLNYYDWPILFLVNLPFVVFIIFIGCFFLNMYKEKSTIIDINYKSNCFFTLSMIFIILFIILVTTWYSFIFLFVGLCSLYAFIKNEKLSNDKLIDFKVFKSKTLKILLGGIFILGGTMSLGFIIPPFYVEHNLHMNKIIVGLVNLSSPLGMVITSRLSSRLDNIFKTTHLLISGLLLMAISYLIIGIFQFEISIMNLTIWLFIFGLGCGVYLPINTRNLLKAVHTSQQSTAGSMQRLVQNIGIIFYSTLSSIVIENINSLNKTITYSILWIFASITLFIIFAITFKFRRRL